MPSIAPPKKQEDLILKHVQPAQYARLTQMWKESDCGLDFPIWLAQKIECEISIRDYNARHSSQGVNVPEPSKRKHRGPRGLGNQNARKRWDLSAGDVAQVKSAVLSGQIPPSHPLAVAAAEVEADAPLPMSQVYKGGKNRERGES